MWLATALHCTPHTAVGDECSQQDSSRERHQEDGDGDTHNNTSTETSSGRFLASGNVRFRVGRLWVCGII